MFPTGIIHVENEHIVYKQYIIMQHLQKKTNSVLFCGCMHMLFHKGQSSANLWLPVFLKATRYLSYEGGNGYKTIVIQKANKAKMTRKQMILMPQITMTMMRGKR